MHLQPEFRQSQTGASSLAILTVLMMTSVILLCVFKLYPAYFDQWAIVNIAEGFEGEATLADISEEEIFARFSKRMQANGVRELSINDILYVEKDDVSVYFEIEYERRVNIYKNIDAVVVFKETREYVY